MHKFLYVIAALAVLVGGLTALSNLDGLDSYRAAEQAAALSTIIFGLSLAGTGLMFAIIGRVVELLTEIRDRLPPIPSTTTAGE